MTGLNAATLRRLLRPGLPFELREGPNGRIGPASFLREIHSPLEDT